MEQPKVFAVADDRPENCAAAVDAIRKKFPDAAVRVFSSAQEVIDVLQTGTSDIGIVLTDMRMEDSQSGHRVACEGWAWNIPTLIVSGGAGHGGDEVRMGYFQTSIKGEKTQAAVWDSLLDIIFFIPRTNNVVLIALRLGKYEKRRDEFGKRRADACVPWGLHTKLE